MDDRLQEVINACRTKGEAAVPDNIPVMSLLTMRNLGNSDIALIRTFQMDIREQLGIEIVVVGGGFGCSRIDITIDNVPRDDVPAILRDLLALDSFRDLAVKVGFFSAHVPGTRLDLSTREVVQTSTPDDGPLLFVSYSPADDEHRTSLVNHLSTLKRQGMIALWHDREVTAGSEWAKQVDLKINNADIILLLISANFLASDYCNGTEMKTALRRHDNGEARVIPVIIRAVDWEGSEFSRLQVLPKDKKPITSCENRDEAWAEVATSIRAVVQYIIRQRLRRHRTGSISKSLA